jgi:hypothetical protein
MVMMVMMMVAMIVDAVTNTNVDFVNAGVQTPLHLDFGAPVVSLLLSLSSDM